MCAARTSSRMAFIAMGWRGLRCHLDSCHRKPSSPVRRMSLLLERQRSPDVQFSPLASPSRAWLTCYSRFRENRLKTWRRSHQQESSVRRLSSSAGHLSASDVKGETEQGIERRTRETPSGVLQTSEPPSWPEGLSAGTGITMADTIRQAAKWLKAHDVVDPEPSATELLAKATGFRSPQDMFSTQRNTHVSMASATVARSAVLELQGSEWSEFKHLCSLRAVDHVPIQYLVGEWDFHGLSLEMEAPSLIPRPETEELVSFVLEWLRREVIVSEDGLTTAGIVDGGATAEGGDGSELHFLDIGSGTGAIGLALLSEIPGSRCVAIDAQQTAIQLSRRNAQLTGLDDRYSCFHSTIADFGAARRRIGDKGRVDADSARVDGGSDTTRDDGTMLEAARRDAHRAREGEAADGCSGNVADDREDSKARDWNGEFDGTFDFIISNPPYIPKRDMEALPADVAEHEDSVALDGGEDGLDVVRDIVQRCPGLLRKHGLRQLWMEVDTSHPEAMQRWLGLETGVQVRGGQECARYGVTRFEWMRDMSQRPRFVRLTFGEER